MDAPKQVGIFCDDMDDISYTRSSIRESASGLEGFESRIVSMAHDHRLSTRPSEERRACLVVGYALMVRGYLKLSTDDELLDIIRYSDAKEILKGHGLKPDNSAEKARLHLRENFTLGEVLKEFPYRYFKLTDKGLAAYSADCPKAPDALPAGTFEDKLEKHIPTKEELVQSVALYQAAEEADDLAEFFSDAVPMVYTEQETLFADTVALLDDGTLIFSRGLPDGHEVIALWTLECAIPNDETEKPGWRQYASDIKRVITLAPIEPESTEGWFYGLENLVEADLSKLDMSRCESAAEMFSGCKSLKTLDVSGWDMYECGDMTEMFAECTSLETVELFELDTSRNGGTYPTGMFYHCRSLKSIDISKWDVSGIDSFTSMFSGCTSLADAKLPSWDYLRSYIEGFDSPAEAFDDEMFERMFYQCDPSLGAPLEQLGCPHELLYSGYWTPAYDI